MGSDVSKERSAYIFVVNQPKKSVSQAVNPVFKYVIPIMELWYIFSKTDTHNSGNGGTKVHKCASTRLHHGTPTTQIT